MALKEARERAKIAAGLQFGSSVHHALGADGTGFYEFNGEELGDWTISDNSGNNNNGAVVQDGEGSATIVDGTVGDALKLTGGGEYSGISIQIPDPGDDSSLDCTNAITIQAWVKPYRTTDTSHIDMIAAKYDVFQFFLTHGHPEFGVWFKDGTSDGVNADDWTIGDNKWYHLVATYYGSKMRLFIDGKEVESKDVPNKNLATNNKPLGIGAMDKDIGHSYYFHYFDGVMDEVRIYCNGF